MLAGSASMRSATSVGRPRVRLQARAASGSVSRVDGAYGVLSSKRSTFFISCHGYVSMCMIDELCVLLLLHVLADSTWNSSC
jgi:hypothetical protein